MVTELAWGEPTGQGWTQVGELGVAFVLSAVIGLERELKQRAAGVRTYTVVGLGAALFVLVSKYGFTDVLLSGKVVLDPSRVAAQIVSGLGFIGGGIIFVKRDSVRGLTTAASVWLTAAVGAAAGAGLATLAAVGTVAYFLTILLLPWVARWVQRRLRAGYPELRIQYIEGHGVLRLMIRAITQAGFSVEKLGTMRADIDGAAVARRAHRGHPENKERRTGPEGEIAEISVVLRGKGDFGGLAVALSEIEGVLTVNSGEDTDE